MDYGDVHQPAGRASSSRRADDGGFIGAFTCQKPIAARTALR